MVRDWAGQARAVARVCALGVGICFWSSSALTAESPEAQFDVLEFRVLGNTVLPGVEVEKAVYPHLGPQKSIADVEAARVSLENAYRAAGYATVFVDIPEQDVDQGVVRLKVTEAKLRRVRVEGARYFSARKIRAALPTATPATVPEFPALQKELATLNTQTPDRSVVPVLGAGPVPGTVDLTLKVKDELPLHASAELNNQYTANTSKLRLLASLSYDNLFNRLDSISFQYQTAPEERKELDVFVASYVTRFGENNNRLAFYFVNSDTDVAALGTLNVLGKGRIFGSRMIFPLRNEAAQTHSLTLGLDYKDFLESIQLDADDSFQTPISYMNLQLGHASVWRSERQQWSLDSSVSFGPRGLQNGTQEFADKRFRGRPNYFYLRSEIGSRTLLWRGASLTARLDGQYANMAMISNEQLSIGGADGPRGYLEAEELGDLGFKTTVQLGSPMWKVLGDKLQLETFAFWDAARVSVVHPLPDEARNIDLSSIGLGINMLSFEHLQGSVAWAYPLVPGSRTEEGDSRVLFSIRSSW
jgi:hemolysin activation/secretion protein